MNYYQQFLDAIFQTLSEMSSPRVLSLVSDFASSGASDCEPIVFPSALQPTNSEKRFLPEGEPFLQEAKKAVANSDADCVFAYPPLMGRNRLSRDFRSQFGSLDLSEAVVSSLVEQVNGQAKVFAFLMPTQFLASLRSGPWRKQFFPDHSAIVIEHEFNLGDLFAQPAAVGVPLCTVVFTKNLGPIRLFKIPQTESAGDGQRLTSDIRKLIRQAQGKSQFGYVLQGALEKRHPTTFDFYSDETQRLRDEVSELGEKVQLQEIADFLIGFRPCHPERDADQGVSDFLTINARDITADGRVNLAEPRLHERPARVQHYLEEGDLCIRQIYSADSGFVVGVFEGDGRRISWNPNVIVIRPRASLLPAQRQVLLSFLRSPLAQRLGSAKQQLSSMGGHLRVSPHVLREFRVPIADKEIVTAFDHLSEARAALQAWIGDIDEAANAIVKESTASGSRNQIIQSGQLARQRLRAASQVEELDYRIRTQFPHPLAYVWRELQVSGPDRYHRLRAITKAAEAHTCFLAQLAILLSRATGKPISYLGAIAKRLRDRLGGTNFGDWFAIIKEVNEARAFRKLDNDAPLIELTTLCADQVWEPAIRRLMELRNHDSHGRVASTSLTDEMLAEAEAELETVFRTTEFLTDYRLLLITETRFDSIRQLNRFQYRDLSGDNALAQRRSDESNRNDLESSSLYLRDRRNELHLLRPMLSYLECPECHQMSTFFLDTFDKNKSDVVGIKSFERNSVRHEPVADDFRHVGLLK